MQQKEHQTILSSLDQELHFLILCTQSNLTKSDIDTILTLYPILDTEVIIHLAYKHGVLPLVYKTLNILSEENKFDDKNTLTTFRQNYLSISKNNMLMTAELLRIMKLFEDNGIDALAFKGPTLGQIAYQDITLRQYNDLDILIDEKNALNAAKLMIEHGHTAILPLTILSNKTCLHAAKDFSLTSKSGGVHTELHWRLFKSKYNIPLHFYTNGNKYQTILINSKPIKTLQNELLLVYLCRHGAKHAFERLEWVCDIDRLIRSVDIDWDFAISIAEHSHTKRSFWLGISLAYTLLRSPIPEKIIANIEQKNIQILQTKTLEKMTNTKEKSDFEKNRENFIYQLMLFDTKADMIRFLLSTFFNISTSDCQTFALPERFKFLYIILRPVRLMWRYFIKSS